MTKLKPDNQLVLTNQQVAEIFAIAVQQHQQNQGQYQLEDVVKAGEEAGLPEQVTREAAKKVLMQHQERQTAMWQQKRQDIVRVPQQLDKQSQASAKNTGSFSQSGLVLLTQALRRTIPYVTGIALLGAMAVGCFQGTISIVKGEVAYWDYQRNARLYFEQAANASTVGLASPNLAHALHWAKTYYPQDSFVCQNLKAAQASLKGQPPSLLMPVSVQSAVRGTAVGIEHEPG